MLERLEGMCWYKCAHGVLTGSLGHRSTSIKRRCDRRNQSVHIPLWDAVSHTTLKINHKRSNTRKIPGNFLPWLSIAFVYGSCSILYSFVVSTSSVYPPSSAYRESDAPTLQVLPRAPPAHSNSQLLHMRDAVGSPKHAKDQSRPPGQHP